MKNILIIDDDEATKELLELYLRDILNDINVYTFKYNKEALEFISNKVPDLIITDIIRTPLIETGFDLIIKIRSQLDNLIVPIIIYSGNVKHYIETIKFLDVYCEDKHNKNSLDKVTGQAKKILDADENIEKRNTTEYKLVDNYFDKSIYTPYFINKINEICKKKYNFVLFKENTGVDYRHSIFLSKLMFEKVNYINYPILILEICLIFERINKKDIDKYLKIKESKGPLNSLELFLKANAISNDNIIENFRDILQFRKIYPIHKVSTNTEKINNILEKWGIKTFPREIEKKIFPNKFNKHYKNVIVKISEVTALSLEKLLKNIQSA